MVAVGGLMVSRVPTLSLKKLPLSQQHAIPVVLVVVVLLGCLYSEPCLTLSATICLYVATFPWVYLKYRRFIKDHQHDADEVSV